MSETPHADLIELLVTEHDTIEKALGTNGLVGVVATIVAAGWRPREQVGWHAGSVAACEGGTDHTITAIHVIVRCACGAAYMSTDSTIALGMASTHASRGPRIPRGDLRGTLATGTVGDNNPREQRPRSEGP